MLVFARERAKELRAAAQAELDALGDVEEPPPDPAKLEMRRKQMDEVVKNLRAKPAEGVMAADLQVKPPLPGARATKRNSEDVVMGGMEQRTSDFVRAEVVLKIERLVDDTIEEIAEYEESAKKHIAIYQGKLDDARRAEQFPGFGNPAPAPPPPINTTFNQQKLKRTVSFSAVPSPSVNSPGNGPYGQPTKGILRSTAASPVDQEGWRRMNVDLPEWEADNYFVRRNFNEGSISQGAQQHRAEVMARQARERQQEDENKQLQELGRGAQPQRQER